MMAKKEHLEFMQVSNPGRKTKIFHIFNKDTDEFLGEIKWDCGWRQYVSEFDGVQHTKLKISSGCHKQFSEFIDELMLERKNA